MKTIDAISWYIMFNEIFFAEYSWQEHTAQDCQDSVWNQLEPVPVEFTCRIIEATTNLATWTQSWVAVFSVTSFSWRWNRLEPVQLEVSRRRHYSWSICLLHHDCSNGEFFVLFKFLTTSNTDVYFHLLFSGPGPAILLVSPCFAEVYRYRYYTAL